MSTWNRLIYISINRRNYLQAISPFLKTIKNVKQNIPLSKFHLVVWQPQKNVFLSKFYQKVLEGSRKIPKGRIFSGMAFFGPSLLFSEDQPHFLKDKDPVLLLQEPNKRDLRGSGRFTKLLFNIFEAICLILRTTQLCLTFFPIILLYPITYFGSYPQYLWWKLLLTGIEFSGPIFIKFGQWASTRRDLFPEACCNQFSRLQRRANPHSWHYTKTQLAKAFGKNWRKTFVKFDNNFNPIGSGCVAQVYKVWMNEEHIKNKDILEEIIHEQDDHEEEKMGLIDDGLEVWGFRDWMSSLKEDLEEEVKAVSEFKKLQGFKRQLDRDKVDQSEDNSSPNIKEVTEELADEIIFQGDSEPRGYGVESNEAKESESRIESSNNATHEENLEHALVEQWQIAPESLEKFLPMTEEPMDHLEGLVPVALKVLHPRVYRTFKRDTTILKCCASFISCLFPPLKWLSLEQCVDEFFHVMAAQIDMRIEAENLEKFIEAFSAVETVRFPRPVKPFVTRRVLVETFEEGEPILNFITEQKAEPVKKNLAKIGVDALLKMIFTDNFIHGDLHPGNILVQNETATYNDNDITTHDGNNPRVMMVDIGDTFVMSVEEDPNPMRICILDCGIVAKLKQKDLNNFRAVFQEVLLGQGEAVADLFLENSEHNCRNPDSFRADMDVLVQSARSNALTLEQVDVGLLLQQVLGLLLRHHVKLESAFSAVVLAVFVLEGLGRSLDPEMDILERARPLLMFQ